MFIQFIVSNTSDAVLHFLDAKHAPASDRKHDITLQFELSSNVFALISPKLELVDIKIYWNVKEFKRDIKSVIKIVRKKISWISKSPWQMHSRCQRVAF